MALCQDLNDHGMTLILVTHDADIGRHCRRTVSVLDGRVVGDAPVADRLLARAAGTETG